MRGAIVRPVVIAAGGTGGHFFPAEALAAELVRRGRRVALMTDTRAAKNPSAAFVGREQFVLSGAGIAGRGIGRAAMALGTLAAGTWQAREILARIDAAAIVGFGGYPSVAPVLATRLLRHRPAVLLHEQNAVLGRANRMLSRFADRLALSHANTQRVPAGVPTQLTGNPVRPPIAALAGGGYAPPAVEIRLLILGGSLGARVFSEVVPPALERLSEALRIRLHVTQQCRAEDLDGVSSAYARSGIAAELAPFFADISTLLRNAHLVIARAGASTVAELGVAGRPAILVPLPGAIDDHQTANARSLADVGGAWMIPQSGFGAEALVRQLEKILAEPELLRTAAANAAACGHADAAARLADLVEAHVAQESTL